jgi:hypothetical protein
MPKLSQIQKADETVEVEVPFGDPTDPVKLVVYPNRITGKRRRELAALDDDDTEGYAELFFDIIKSWDLTDDKDKVLPFTADIVDLLSVKTTMRIFTEIGEATNPNPKTSKRSRGR